MTRFSTPQELDVLAGICRAVKKTPDTWASQQRDTIFTHFWRELKRDLICFPHNKMDMSCLDIYLLSQVGGHSVCQTRQLALKIWTCVGFKCVCACICEGCVLYFLCTAEVMEPSLFPPLNVYMCKCGHRRATSVFHLFVQGWMLV